MMGLAVLARSLPIGWKAFANKYKMNLTGTNRTDLHRILKRGS